jgi:hypothetical protein
MPESTKKLNLCDKKPSDRIKVSEESEAERNNELREAVKRVIREYGTTLKKLADS